MIYYLSRIFNAQINALYTKINKLFQQLILQIIDFMQVLENCDFN